eukprot:6825063-Alexandrium_andersonii.AAC.1
MGRKLQELASCSFLRCLPLCVCLLGGGVPVQLGGCDRADSSGGLLTGHRCSNLRIASEDPGAYHVPDVACDFTS